jgi:hypothetical protein
MDAHNQKRKKNENERPRHSDQFFATAAQTTAKETTRSPHSLKAMLLRGEQPFVIVTRS